MARLYGPQEFPKMRMTGSQGKRTFSKWALACSLVVLLAGTATAGTIYSYTGSTFDQFYGGYTCAGTCSITGWFSVATAFAPNQTNFTFTPTAFSFTDGHFTLTEANTT